jgi:hypothetical protein
MAPPRIRQKEWLNFVNAYFDACKTTNEDQDNNQHEAENENNPSNPRATHHSNENSSRTSTRADPRA